MVACSAGLALFPTDGRTAGRLLRSADAAMYRVKRGGGDAHASAEHVMGADAHGRTQHPRLPLKRLARA
ncbi:MAG: hypothetical protein R3C32_14360 [Chloroflexota bacterium]